MIRLSLALQNLIDLLTSSKYCETCPKQCWLAHRRSTAEGLNGVPRQERMR